MSKIEEAHYSISLKTFNISWWVTNSKVYHILVA